MNATDENIMFVCMCSVVHVRSIIFFSFSFLLFREKGADAVGDVIALLDEYGLSKEDLVEVETRIIRLPMTRNLQLESGSGPVQLMP